MIGETISRFPILEELGDGGRGVACEAEDTTLRRGEGNLNLDWLDIPDNPVKLDQMLLVGEILKQLEELEPQQVPVVELHYFGGMTVPETAKALDISTSTVDREWQMAKAWMRRELSRKAKA